MEKTENKKKENTNRYNKDKKTFLLRVLVFSFTILILFAWIFNLKSRLKNAEDLSFVPRDENYQELRDSLNETLSGVENGLDKLKETNQKSKESELEDFYSIPEDLEDNQGDSVNNNEEIYLPIIKRSSCPEYVNCMPTIGGPARACNIPPGCEGITQIVW